MYSEIVPFLEKNNTQLIAVSKTKPNEAIMAIYNQGQRAFGENRIQELVEKQEQLPKEIQWHFIGHLQTNKVKYVASFVHCIHSVDSLKLLQEINKQARKHHRTIQCLLQFKIAAEESKFGLDMESAKSLLTNEAFAQMDHITIAGVMGMATFTNSEVQVRNEFARLKSYFNQLQQTYFADSPAFKEISMGMSGDYQIAVEEGSTMVRIGSLIFGARN